jgi:Tol biopolymer transport system component
MLIRPDGTGVKFALTLNDSSQNFGWSGPVWSPDSKQLLLNVTKDDGPLLDVVLLDLATRQTTTKAKNSLPVFAWASSRQ